MGARQAPDRMLFARPRQPAAGRRPPLSPEHAATGRPLPRVTATDDLVPRARPQSAGRLRPPPGSPDGALPAADRLRRTTDLASTHRRLALSRAARGPSREAQTCAAVPDRRPGPSGRTPGPPGTRRGTSLVPRVRPAGSGRGGRIPAAVAPGTTGPRSRGSRGRERCWTTSPGSVDIVPADAAPRPPP